MKLLLVEDSRLLRERLRGMIAGIPGAEVVAEADTEAEARARIVQFQPDVVVLDLRLRSGSGLSVLEYLKAAQPDSIVIVFTNYGHAEYRAKCINLGADYFLDKSRDIEEFYRLLTELNERLFMAAPAVVASDDGAVPGATVCSEAPCGVGTK